MHWWNLVAPAGTPTRVADFAAATSRFLVNRSNEEELRNSLRTYTGEGAVYFANTGRAAMTLLAEAIKAEYGTRNRFEVILPAYTCYSVAASFLRAGLRIRVCDIDPLTLSYDRKALSSTPTENALAIVTANLYGLPNDLHHISEFAQQHSLLMIDDAAQSLGAKIGTNQVGSFGAAGLFSFDKGKVITSMQGGSLVIRDSRLNSRFRGLLANIPPTTLTQSLVDYAKYAAYVTMLNPRLYWLTGLMPFLGLGRTRYETDFPITSYSSRLAGIAASYLPHLEKLQSDRTATAEEIGAALQGDTYQTIRTLPDAVPAWIRLPVLAANRDTRIAAISRLNDEGIGASRSYPFCLTDVPEIKDALVLSHDTPGARSVADRLFTVPTHRYMTEEVRRTAIEALGSVASQEGRETA